MNKLAIGGIAIMATMATMAADAATKTARLVYPQWQGARMQDGWIPEVKDLKDASRGYMLGSQILELLAPKNTSHKTLTVPVATDYGAREIVDGVTDRDTIAAQTRAAVAMLKAENPGRVITLGGECSVSVPPFTYLAEKYGGDVAVLWIDAHPDITLPGDVYPAYLTSASTP